MPKENSSRSRIYLVDDHPMIRERLTQLIERQPDLLVCGEASSASEALLGIAVARPSLAVIDISLKDSNGLELIKDLKAQFPNLPVLVLSMHDESLYGERAIRAGAKGYITKQEATTKVLSAIRKILGGELYLSEQMIARVLNRAINGQIVSSSPIETLADRELEVLQMIGRGKGTRQIAEELHIGIKTVESYRARIKEKLGLETAGELIQYAVKWINGIESK